MGCERNWVSRSAYLAVLGSAADAAADPALLAAASKYDGQTCQGFSGSTENAGVEDVAPDVRGGKHGSK